MPSLPSIALPHRARVIATVRLGAKDAQGERVPTPYQGPWFPARRMTRRPGREGARDPGGAARAEKPWSLIWGDEDDAGAPLEAPQAGDRVQVEVELDAGPIRRYTYEIAGAPGDFDAGGGAFGGQAELLEVQDSA